MAGSIELLLDTPLLAAAGPLLADAGPLVQGLLAQSDEVGLVSLILTQIWLWARVALGIGLVIFVHELGHFLAAKWCGVKVEKFYVGFDVPIRLGPIRFPRTLIKFRHGETEYGIGTIPLGGYVKMLGQDDDPRRFEEEARRVRQQNAADGEIDAVPEADQPVRLDPRSFPAKSVWQRMIIISAGVVMNLVTGVMFAAAAFLYGVPYLPAVVGDVTPGGPAYKAGIEPGGKVVAVGGIRQDDQLYFSDMATAIMLEGTDHPDRPVNVEIEYPDGVRSYELKTAEVAAIPGLRRIGISNIATTYLPSAGRLAAPGSVAASVLSEADAGAEVIAVDDMPIEGAGQRDNVQGSVMLQRRIIARPGHPLNLQLRRADGSTSEVVIPPQRRKMPGIGLAVGPVVAVVAGGPAEQAGVKAGDVLIAVDGEQNLDAIALPEQLADVDGPVSMTFRRADGEQSTEVQLELHPTDPLRTSSPLNTADNVVALDRLGLAYQALPTVSVVYPPSQTAAVAGEAEGDAAQSDPAAESAEAGLRAGDVLKKVVARWSDDAVPAALAAKHLAPVRDKLKEGWEFNAEYPLAALIELWQFFPEGTPLRITVLRDGRIVDVDTQLSVIDGHWYDRGLRFAELERTHVADGLGHATTLGIEASKRRLTEVFRFLGMLVTGKASADLVGGPITIFRVAGHETSRGIPALLMFLTLLSMNLAILNFLPIPALDGGHMLFLTAEAVLGRPVNEKLQMQLTMAGVLALLSLMAFAIFNDIRRL